jgi:hypothetical protein
MTEVLRQLRIFIASPGDCGAEREVVRRITSQDQTIRTLCRDLGASIDVFGWEEVPPDLGRPQSLINTAVEKFNPHWFVFIFWHRFGSDAGLGMTGSEEEWNLALRMHKEGGGQPVSIYFNQADPPWNELDGYQFEALKKFRSSVFADYQALAASFRGTHEFEEQFRAHLTARLLKLSEQGTPSQPSGIDRLRQEFFAASQGLLHWPRTIGNNQPIERSELQQLLERIQESEYSTTLILGGPGTGKSALLATLGQHLHAEGVCFLAIKADMLGRDLHTFEDLQRNELHLSVDPRDAIRALAEQECVVLLVDQLDAVSELLDQHSGCLNILLNLMHSLSRTPHVHIVATSREFEFRHDVRLSTLEAESMQLALPAWEQIASLLTQSGHNPSIMAEPLRELLRTPLHLKIFLDVAAPGTVFESLQALLEKLWEQRVVGPEGPRDRLMLLEQLANRMTEEETLWLPAAAADEYPEARQALEQAEILTRGPNGQTLGFRHQSYYDYTLARAFARGSVSLADHVLQRQDGLFVRPTLLSGLHYLRDTARTQYHQQLQRLMASGLRSHMRALLLEFLGELKDPDETEAAILLPLLTSQEEAPRVLSVVAGSPGWFTHLRYHSGMAQWMRKPLEEAIYCLPLLRAAVHFACEQVLNLLEECWLNEPTYDAFSLSVISDFTTWSPRALAIAERLVHRASWDRSYLLIDRITESDPDLAPRVLRAELDRRLQQALADIPQPEPALPSEADEQQRILHDWANRDRPVAPLYRLIENDEDWYDLETLAKDAPKAFLDWIWPWFLDVVYRVTDDEDPFVVGYRRDRTAYRGFDDTLLPPPPMVSALLTAVTTFAEREPTSFWNFAAENSQSELMIVHRLLVLDHKESL